MYARLDMVVIRTMVYVRHRIDDAPPTVNVDRTKSVYNPANVFVRHHFSWTPAMEISVKVRVNDLRAVLMPNVHRVIHRNVCVKLVSRAIRCEDVFRRMNAIIRHAPTEHSALALREDINVSVPRGKLEMRTKVDAFYKMDPNDICVVPMKIVHRIWPVLMVIVLVHVLVCCAVVMRTVNRKIMPLGVGAALDSLKAVSTANVFRHVKITCVAAMQCAL